MKPRRETSLTAFGFQRDCIASANEVATFNSMALVTEQSGKSWIVHRRNIDPKDLCQTFHEFADHAKKWCPWCKTYFRLQKRRGMKYHAAIAGNAWE